MRTTATNNVVIAVMVEAIEDLAEENALNKRYSTAATIIQQKLAAAVGALKSSTSSSLEAVQNFVQMNFYARVFSVAGGFCSVVVMIALVILCYSSAGPGAWVGLGGIILEVICQIAQIVFVFKESATSGVISNGIQISTATASPRTLELLSSMAARIFATNAHEAMVHAKGRDVPAIAVDDSDKDLLEESLSGASQGEKKLVVVVVRSRLNKHRISDSSLSDPKSEKSNKTEII